jgi:hypothetical protein
MRRLGSVEDSGVGMSSGDLNECALVGVVHESINSKIVGW